jgi:malto-oligosyltrehalose trehalohydrolase
MRLANPHGALLLDDGRIRFRLWAPACERIELHVCGKHEALPMEARAEGWHELITDRATAGDRYYFVLPSGLRIPDPASRFQPEDVHGPSEIIDTSRWRREAEWKGRSWNEAVVYELHTGTFTPEGTFEAAIAKLDHLVDLGVTAIEMMPVADFPGRRNWGYDGVLLYAPDSSYGRPEAFKLLIEEAHARGLMVLLDVVYNHFGPDGNYLSLYAPQFFTDRHHTPWGQAINYDGPGCRAVRNFVVNNAVYWIEEFGLDGLRLDAVHTISDDSPRHILNEIAEHTRAAAEDRHIHLILENGRNQARWLERDYTAQWNDDVHHTLHTVTTGESGGYYADYLGDTIKLGRSLAEGFAYQGETMSYNGELRGEPSVHLPPTRFVAFLQNHDQIGNRAFGDRISRNTSDQAIRAASAVYLLLPQIPMLFMGEEWNAQQPFPFFCDFGPGLATAVREGRRNEFSRFPDFQDPATRERIPDPQSEETFASGKLRWEELDSPEHREWFERYRRLLQTRRESVWPLLERIESGAKYEVLAPGAVVVRWRLGQGGALQLAANFSDRAVQGFPEAPGSPFWQEGVLEDGGRVLQPWSVLWGTDEEVR